MKFPNQISKVAGMLGFNKADLSRMTGYAPPVIGRLWNGERKLHQGHLDAISRALGVPQAALIAGSDSREVVTVRNYIGAGAKVYPIDDFSGDDGLEEVDCPVGFTPDGVAALVVRGDSMEPMMEKGWLIFYRKKYDGVPPDCIGKLCVVELTDGCLLVKEIQQGSKPGLFHLISKNVNHKPMFDAKVKWASRVIDIRPR